MRALFRFLPLAALLTAFSGPVAAQSLDKVALVEPGKLT